MIGAAAQQEEQEREARLRRLDWCALLGTGPGYRCPPDWCTYYAHPDTAG